VSWRTTKAREQLAELNVQCAAAFKRGSETQAYDALLHAWEYHRLNALRQEAWERVLLSEKMDAMEASNDNASVPSGSAEPLVSLTGV
jgi:hypothetical protein